MKNYLEIKSLNVRYIQGNKETNVLNNINLTLDRGKIGVLIGPSGCGKSTLLNVMAGLNTFYEGSVSINGDSPEKGKETSLILQNYGLLPWKTVSQNIVLGLKIKKVPKKKAFQKTKDILNELGLLDLAKRYPSQLSGGQRQRIAIARSLVLNPKLLLMDEPFSSLDALTREDMQNLLLKVWKETQITILLVTHNIEESVFLGHKIFIMSSSPGHIKKEIENEMAGDYNLRNKIDFLNMCNSLRSFL